MERKFEPVMSGGQQVPATGFPDRTIGSGTTAQVQFANTR